MPGTYPFARDDALWDEQIPYQSLFLSPVNMNVEERRLQTFRFWPGAAPAIKNDLAKDGFFFTGEQDIVKCFACGIQLKQWKKSHSPRSRHHASSPNCTMVLNIANNNVAYYQSARDSPPAPLGGPSSSSSSSASSSSGEESAPGGARARDLLVGLETDGAAVGTRSVGKPRVKEYAEINVIKVKKGKGKIDQSYEMAPNKAQPKETKPVLSDQIDAIQASVKSVGALGFSSSHIQIALKQLTDSGEKIESNSLLDIIYTIQDDAELNPVAVSNETLTTSEVKLTYSADNETKSSSSSEHTTSDEEKAKRKANNERIVREKTNKPIVRGNTKPDSNNFYGDHSSSICTDTSSSDEERAKQRENLRLKKENAQAVRQREYEQAVEIRKIELLAYIQKDMCISCHKEKARTLLLPCAHIATCEGCTENMKRCPICSKLIRGTKEVYYS